MRIKLEEKKTTVDCGLQMDISTVEEQKVILLQALQPKNTIYLHTAEISAIDTAGLQLLISFCLTADQSQITWRWMNVSEKLLEIAQLLGADKLLKLPLTAES